MQVNANAMSSLSNWMNNSAHNIANVNTQDFAATRTAITSQGETPIAQSTQTKNETNVSKEISDQIVIEKSLEANANSIKAKDQMIGSLLDLTI